MQYNNKFTTALFLSLSIGNSLPSQASEQSDVASLIAKANTPRYASQASGSTTSSTATTTSKPTPTEHHILPFYGDEARALGYDLPEPFGINLSYMGIRQNLDVQSIQFTNLQLENGIPIVGGHKIPNGLIQVNAKQTRQKSNTENARFDAWILPFLNVYGILGYTKGHSSSIVSVSADPSKYNPISDFDDWAIAEAINAKHLNNLNFRLDFKGITYGTGFTLAGGYNNWFATLDNNYTRTSFNILDGYISAYTLSPRVGYRAPLNWVGLPNSHASLWIGSMYQNVQQEFKGNLSDLVMPADLADLMNMANANGDGRFDVKQRLTSPWNVLIGSQFEMTKNFNIIAEVGFEQRNSMFVSAEYRF